jgi:hypothetical protein
MTKWRQYDLNHPTRHFTVAQKLLKCGDHTLHGHEEVLALKLIIERLTRDIRPKHIGTDWVPQANV